MSDLPEVECQLHGRIGSADGYCPQCRKSDTPRTSVLEVTCGICGGDNHIEYACPDRPGREPDNFGDSDRWEDPRDTFGGQTDCDSRK